ncbi:MAG: PhzF family phenazine biosynthesis protein [Pseudomonadota bacterium]|nr:PhzF family phenazine biosynthesis protein [Pseudomonadota bacterium]
MPSIRYRLVNVFAETPFGGNPLAVVEDASMLTDAEMQLVARQFNLSETSFLLPSTCAAARIRIFTPTYEMPFAGHPTLGSAHVVSTLPGAGDRFALEMAAGVIPVHRAGGRWHLAANRPAYRPMAATPAELAAMLGLPLEAIGGPALWVDCGAEQPMIPLTSVDFVHACRPDPALVARYSRNTSGHGKSYVFARTPEGFESRYFWMPGSSLSEDPGTGSACANLGGWWLATQGNVPLHATVRQGTLIARPNVLTLDVADGKIQVGGRVIEIGGGTLTW